MRRSSDGTLLLNRLTGAQLMAAIIFNYHLLHMSSIIVFAISFDVKLKYNVSHLRATAGISVLGVTREPV